MFAYRTLNDISLEEIHNCFQDAFSNYFVSLDLTFQDLKYMIERRGIDLDLSWGVFDNDFLVGVVLNGVGYWQGNLTAYDIGTGVRQLYQNKGLATGLLEHLMPMLQEKGFKKYLLEVIQSNKSAVRVYQKSNFEITREFNCFTGTIEDISISKRSVCKLIEMQLDANTEQMMVSFWDYEPSWQNSMDAIKRKKLYFKIIGAFDDGSCVGYGIIEPNTGDIPQIAVHRDRRREGIASHIFTALLKQNQQEKLKCLNADSRDDALTEFLFSTGLHLTIKQFEMALRI